MTATRAVPPLLLLLAASAAGQVMFAGSCPRPPVVRHFQAERYLGKWYEYSNYFAIFQVGGTCVTATYSDAGYGRIGVLNQSRKNGRKNDIRGQAVPAGRQGEAKLRVSFQGTPSFGSGPNYNVIDTDYHNYAIVWSCTDMKLFNAQILWILTRERFPDPYLIKDVRRKIRRYGLDPSKLQRTDQKNCPYGH
ncbi:apolipoprotein D-like [Pollicipes pollicipes]|uniref:apolipoprotein D-like n=1 Tax=Pollicipes pollicipes TaxID=41117 RepID=UPI0018859C9C|nr:apolipoprotein D-like [Pollicipes pollicipes]